MVRLCQGHQLLEQNSWNAEDACWPSATRKAETLRERWYLGVC